MVFRIIFSYGIQVKIRKLHKWKELINNIFETDTCAMIDLEL